MALITLVMAIQSKNKKLNVELCILSCSSVSRLLLNRNGFEIDLMSALKDLSAKRINASRMLKKSLGIPYGQSQLRMLHLAILTDGREHDPKRHHVRMESS